MSEKIRTLYELLSYIKKFFDSNSKIVSIKMEINKLNLYKNGACYPELVWKESWKIVAKSYGYINPYNTSLIQNKLSKYGYQLKDGIIVVAKWKIFFDVLKGIRIELIDIDIQSMLWEIEKAKLETINKLKQLQIFDKNKKLSLPFLIQNIAVISVSTSKWFADFKHIIEKSGYNIDFQLFEASMQWENVSKSIIWQLKQILPQKDKFDIVAIIRWWGGDSELVEYNDFELSKMICEYPLPVFTGIWHSTNTTIIELVSNKNFITPTDLAKFIVERFQYFDKNLKHIDSILQMYTLNLKKQVSTYRKNLSFLTKSIRNFVKDFFEIKYNALKSSFFTLKYESQQIIYKNKLLVDNKRDNLHKSVIFFIDQLKSKLLVRKTIISENSIDNILSKWFALIKHKDKYITDIKHVKENMNIDINFYNWTAKANIKKVKLNWKK